MDCYGVLQVAVDSPSDSPGSSASPIRDSKWVTWLFAMQIFVNCGATVVRTLVITEYIVKCNVALKVCKT